MIISQFSWHPFCHYPWSTAESEGVPGESPPREVISRSGAAGRETEAEARAELALEQAALYLVEREHSWVNRADRPSRKPFCWGDFDSYLAK